MPRHRSGKRLLKALLPIVGLLLFGGGGGLLWLAYTATHPPIHPYLVTPEGFERISTRAVKATEETWANADGTRARGWLLRGGAGAPAVVLLHAYGTDRSWLFNLCVKINEATNFTVLCPDLRGHGQAPLVPTTTFGAREAADLASALDFLRSLKTQQQRPQVGGGFGVYGVELGAYAALLATARAGEGADIRSLVLDSVPASPDELVRTAVRQRTGLDGTFLATLARAGVRLYFLGGYEDRSACGVAASVAPPKVLLLTGEDAGQLRASTLAIAKCFPAATSVEVRGNLPVTGLKASSATGEVGETYDRNIIEFFQHTLHSESSTQTTEKAPPRRSLNRN